MSTHVGLTCLKTTNAKNRENIPRPDRDPGGVCYTCKKLLHSIFQYKDRQLNRTWSQPVPGCVVYWYTGVYTRPYLNLPGGCTLELYRLTVPGVRARICCSNNVSAMHQTFGPVSVRPLLLSEVSEQMTSKIKERGSLQR